MVELVLSESVWTAFALVGSYLVACLTAWSLWLRHKNERSAILRSGSAYFGCIIGTMALGHVVAVIVALATGKLAGAPGVLIPLGFAMLIPATYLVGLVIRHQPTAKSARKYELGNLWLALTIVVIGVHNLPLAVPGILNILYGRIDHRIGSRTIAVLLVVFGFLLALGGIRFGLSGQSFEDFA